MKNQTYQNIVRVALYIRVSTEEQALHGYSLEAQETALKEYAEQNGYKIVNIYRDEGFSARKPVMKRKVMQELLTDVQAGKIDMILFTKLDRWFRNVGDYHQVQAVLDKHNVVWKTILEDYQTATADGRLKVNIMLSVAENEADRTSERIRFVFENKRQNKEYCNSHTPFGYKVKIIDGKRRLIKDEEKAPIIEFYFDLLLKYKNVLRAARETNLKFGLTLSLTAWQKIAKSRFYIGEFHGIKDFCPAYISESDFESFQNPKQRIKKTQNNRVYLFTGLLRCPVCGRSLGSSYSSNPSRSKEYFCYRCTNRNIGNCAYSRQLSETKLEIYLLSHIKELFEQFVIDSQIKLKEKKKTSKKTDVAKLKEQLRRLNTIYLNGNISDSDYTTRSAEINAAIKEAEQEEKEIAQVIDFSTLRHFLEYDFENVYKDLTREEKQRLWHSIISEIHFNDNQVSHVIFKA